jgi:mannose-6-phosphate isomerase-like protein (cupin superfamily)
MYSGLLQENIHILQKNLAETRAKFYNIESTLRHQKPANDKWSKKEILGHLIDSARYNLMRISEIIFYDGIYSIKPYDQDQLVKINNYQAMPEEEIMTIWRLLNKMIIQTLENIDEHHLQKQIISGNEPLTLMWLIDDYVQQMNHHLAQIFDTASTQMTEVKIGKDEAEKKLIEHFAHTKSEFISLLRHGDLEIEYYKPVETDKQTPHLKDEVYVIASGSGEFQLEDKNIVFDTGDVLFVQAGLEHRFVRFSDDFATWVIFFGMSNT